MAEAPTLGLTGDVMLGRLVDENQQSRPVHAVWGDTLERLVSFDALGVNLECVLSRRGRPWRRTHRPFHFRADPSWAIRALERAHVTVVSLANNHVLDFEEPALFDTIEHLEGAGIAHVGAGENRSAAFEPVTIQAGSLSIGFVAMTDNTPEFAATPDRPGTAYVPIEVDLEETLDRAENALRFAREREPDVLVASLHWGPNMVERPPAGFREFARWLVEQGVDLVWGHSAHVLQGVEVIDGRPVLYDVGDFVDDYAVDRRLRNDRGVIVEVELTPAEASISSMRFVPIEIGNCSVNHASDQGARWIRDRLRELSTPFGTHFERSGAELVLEPGD